MTDAEKDAVWRSLPDGFKKEVSRHYKSWHNSLTFGGECAVLDYIFGKHNLTATEEEPFLEIKDADAELICRVGENPILSVKSPIGEPKPKFKVGDKVITIANGPLYGAGWPGIIEKIDGIWAVVRMFTKDEVVFKANIDHLIPYTEEQEPKEGNINNEAERILLESLKISASARLAEKNIKWHVYRMELAKAICPNVICAVSENGVSSDFCKSVIDKVTTIVDGIVERLKGGDK